MKKYIYRIVFSFLLIFMYTKVVYADLICSNSSTISETSFADPTGMHAYMPICGKKTLSGYREVPGIPSAGVPEGQSVSDGDFDAVRKRGDRLDDAYIKRADGKGVVKTQVVVCGSPLAYLKGTMTCKYTATADYTTEDVMKEVTVTNCNPKTNGTEDSSSTAPAKDKLQVLEQNSNVLYINPELNSIEVMNPKASNMRLELPDTDIIPVTPADDDDDDEECTTSTSTVLDYVKHNCPENYTLVNEGEDDEHCEAELEYIYEKDKINKSTGTKITVKEAEGACKKAVGYDCECDKTTVKYAFMCPVYKCEVENTKMQLCTPSFQSASGDPAYCVNPGQFFSDGFSTTSQYTKDGSFDVFDCETSYSTVDCGYANILIEGQYYNIPRKTIETALRLWGVHTQQAGFDAVGLSIRSGENCQDSVLFMRTGGETGDVINPYVELYKQFARVLLDKVRFNDEINPTQDLETYFLGCDKDVLGVACGDETSYQQALALLANTVLGNSHMKEHLKSFFSDEINEKPESAEIISDGSLNSEEEGTQYIEIRFEGLAEITKRKNVKINCKDLNGMVKSGAITPEQKDYIEEYCQVEAYIVDARGNRLTEFGGGTPEYCYKNYCRTRIKKFAVCDIENSGKYSGTLSIDVVYDGSNSSESIEKYVSCSNPNENQLLFAFDFISNEGGGTDYKPGSDKPEETNEYFPIVNYKCNNYCEDYSVKSNIKNKCDDDTSNYGGSYSSSIKDPSLKCILNMGNAAYKNAYNYSDDFEIGNKFCRVYCSDEISYHIADKIRETSGRIFYYDIENTVRTEKDVKYLFSNIVQLKRTCVSEIYYRNDFAESVNWKKIYSLGKDARGGSDGIDEARIAGIKNWQALFDVLIEKAETEGGRTENLNKILYDLYNCNLYSDAEIKAMGVTKPKKYKAKNIKESILEKFSSANNYGIGVDANCVIDPKTNRNDCIKMNNISYDFGPAPDGKSISMKSVTKINNTIGNLSYCSGKDCFKYDPEHKENEYNYPTSKNSSTLSRSVDVGGDSAKVFSGGVTIPTNDYAVFDIVADVAFYNASRFEVKPSGEVINKGKEKGKNYLLLDAYTFPIDYNAYNSRVCSTRSFLDPIGYRRCNINQTFDRVETFFRRNPGDEFYSIVNLNKNFGCYVDVEVPTTLGCTSSRETCRIGTNYRNVDLGKMFPSSQDGYSTVHNSNWATDNGKQATDEIESTADDLRGTEKYLQYRITLSPAQIKSLKEYNKENSTSYVGEEKLNCRIVDSTYQECTSPFLERLREGTEYGTIDTKYNGGK